MSKQPTTLTQAQKRFHAKLPPPTYEELVEELKDLLEIAAVPGAECLRRQADARPGFGNGGGEFDAAEAEIEVWAARALLARIPAEG